MARVSAEPVTPVWAITCFAWKSESGSRLERWPRPTWSGCDAATSSMSMPPMSLNSIIGRFARPVPDHAGVVLLGDLGLWVDEHAARHVPVDLELQDRGGVLGGLIGRVRELDAARLHPPAGQDLRLDHHRPADLAAAAARASSAVVQKPYFVTGIPARSTIRRDSYS